MASRRVRARVVEEEQGAAANVLHSPEQAAQNMQHSPPPPYNAANEAPQGNAQIPPADQFVNAMNLMMQQQREMANLLARSQNEARDGHNALIALLQNLGGLQNPNPVRAPPNAPPPANAQNNAQGGAGNQRVRTHHLKSADIKIPTYCGATDPKTPYDYLLEIEKYQTIVGYTSQEVLEFIIPVSLIGDADQWFRYEPAFASWQDFATRLRSEFQAVGYVDDLKRELDFRYQGPDETLTAFIRIILDYYRRIGERTTEQQQVTKIKRLMHPEYRKALIGLQTNTLQELRAAAIQAQEIIKGDRSYKLPPLSGSLEPSLAWKPEKKANPKTPTYANVVATMPTQNLQAPQKLHPAAVDPYTYHHAPKQVKFNISPQPSRSPSPIQRPQPPARDTSPVRRCFACSSASHFAKDCPLRNNANQSTLCADENEETATVELANKDKKPFIKVKILEKDFPAFLDTGSSISVLGDDVIALLKSKNIKCRAVHKTIKFLQGTYIITEAVHLNIMYGTESRKHLFYLAPSTIKTVLLGRDFLGPAMIAVHIGQGGWSIGSAPGNVFPFLKGKIPFLRQMHNMESDLNDESLSSDESLLMEKFEYPCQALSLWDHVEVEKSAERNEHISLFPDPAYEEIKIPNTLTEENKRDLRNALHEFLPLFTRAPGLCTLYEHEINTGDSKPISTTLRPMTPAKRKIYEEAFKELLQFGIIEPSTSPWSANSFVVPKKDGTLRPVIDYKPLNKVTIPDAYPIPRINDQITLLGPCSWFSLFDISKGYYQIAMKESDKHKTTFISPFGSWQYVRLPMGLRSAPATFQRCMDKVLGTLKWSCCTVYYDDVCVFSKSFAEHVQHIKLVLSKIREAGLTIHPGKVQLCRNKIKYLGFIIEPGKCLPDPDKVRCLKEYPRPNKAKDIKRFLGFVGFYMRFIPHYSTHARHLTKLVKKNVKFEWNPAAEAAFQTLKNSLSEYTLLHLPDLNKQFIIQTDASNFCIGAILQQEVDGIRYPVWYASKTLTKPEINYSTTEKEILAVLWAIEKFQVFIEYTHFIVETDHRAISWLNKLKDPTGRLGRWFLKMQMYDFEVCYRKGSSEIMKGADALSRICMILYSENKTNHISREEFISAQNADPILLSIKQYILSTEAERPPQKEASQCALTDDNLLMKYVGCQNKPWEDERLFWRIYVPEKLQNKIICIFHDDELSCHLGIRKTLARLEQRVYWRNMRKAVQQYIQRCTTCQESKAARLPPVPASSFGSSGPWDLVTIDLMGPYIKGKNQNTYILLCVDHFTRFVEIYPLRKATSDSIIQKLWDLCTRWGMAKYLLSDNGTQFTSKLYANWCESLGITPYYISAYHPQANLTERYCQTVKNMIICMSRQCRDWDVHLPEIAFALRTCTSDSTGMTPAYANYGRELRTPFDNLMRIELSQTREVRDIALRLNTVHNVLKETLEASQEKYIKYYNKRAKSREYKIGEQVWIRSHFLSDSSRGITASLTKKREGPYQVVEIIAKNIYKIIHCASGAVVNKVHANELSPYFQPLSDDGSESKTSSKKEASVEATADASVVSLDDAANNATIPFSTPENLFSGIPSQNPAKN